jgi:hypothetical protein
MNPNDSYLGSGFCLVDAIRKYGKENFKKEVLFIFDNREEMLAKERELVVVDRDTTYNLIPGGGDTWKPEDRERILEICRETGREANKRIRKRYHEDSSFKEKMDQATLLNLKKATSAAMSPESRLKRLSSFKEIEHAQGEKNSQYGTCWVTRDDHDLKVKRENLEAYLNDGYALGRGISFRNRMKAVGFQASSDLSS